MRGRVSVSSAGRAPGPGRAPTAPASGTAVAVHSGELADLSLPLLVRVKSTPRLAP